MGGARARYVSHRDRLATRAAEPDCDGIAAAPSSDDAAAALQFARSLRRRGRAASAEYRCRAPSLCACWPIKSCRFALDCQKPEQAQNAGENWEATPCIAIFSEYSFYFRC